MEEGRYTSRKRKRASTREEEIRRLEDELELVRLSMEELRVEIKGNEVPGMEHEVEKDSLKIPVREIEESSVKHIFMKFEESVVIDVPSVEEAITTKFSKSPNKILIAKYKS